MTDDESTTRFPAVERIRNELRSDLMRGARSNRGGARFSFFRRRGVAAVVVLSLVATPGALAGAGVFDSSAEFEIDYECAEAEKLHEDAEVVAGEPVEGPGAPDSVTQEKGTEPAAELCD